MQLPQTIIDKLNAKDINQKSIATVLGCDLSTVHCTIYGKRRNVRIANTIAAILGEPVNALFSFINLEPKPRKKTARPPKPTPQEIDALRIEILAMLEKEYGSLSRKALADKLAKFTGKPVNICSLSMNLSGHRKTKSSMTMLRELRSMIENITQYNNTHI